MDEPGGVLNAIGALFSAKVVHFIEERELVHNLDFQRIALVLQKFHYSGEAHANIPPQPKMRDGGQVVLTVKDGQIVSCLILDRLGRMVFHGRGFSPLLTKLGVLEWDLVRTSSSPSHMNTGPITPAPRGITPPPEGMRYTPGVTPPPEGMRYVPRGVTPPLGGYPNQPPPSLHRQTEPLARSRFPRQRTVPQEQIRLWPILQRSVYKLCDGTHNYEHIATLLSRPLQEIERIVDTLRRSHAIEEE